MDWQQGTRLAHPGLTHCSYKTLTYVFSFSLLLLVIFMYLSQINPKLLAMIIQHIGCTPVIHKVRNKNMVWAKAHEEAPWELFEVRDGEMFLNGHKK